MYAVRADAQETSTVSRPRDKREMRLVACCSMLRYREQILSFGAYLTLTLFEEAACEVA